MLSVKYFLILIVSFISIKSFAQDLKIPGLVAYLPFNGNFNDESGNGNNPTEATDTVFTSDRFGKPQSAFYFEGGFIKIPPLILGGNPSHTAYVFSGDFTISFWEKANTFNRLYAFSIDGADGVSQNLNIEFNDLIDFWGYWNSDGAIGVRTQTNMECTDGKWHHILLRRTSSPHKIEIFVDRIKIGSDSTPTNQTIGSDTADVYIGQNIRQDFGQSMFPWHGKLDDIMIFNRALNDIEMHTIYTNGIIASIPFNQKYIDEIDDHKLSRLSTTADSSDFPSFTSGRFGCLAASYFNGNGYLKLETFNKNPISPLLNFFDKDFSISFWEKSSKAGTTMYALSIDDTTNTNNLNIKFNAGSGCEVYWNGNSNNITCGIINQYTDDQWHHIVLRRNTTQSLIELFIDSIPVGSQTDASLTIGSNLDDIIIGHFNNNGWQGSLDDFIFFNRYISNKEIQDLYSQPVPGIYFTNPKINESWAINSKHIIAWESDFNGLVDIEYSSDGITWATIVKKQETSDEILNQYLWNIPSSPATTYQIRIKRSESNCLFLSNSFNIIPSEEISCYKWSNITLKGNFAPRDGAGALVYNNAMWILGGWNPDNPSGFFNTTTNDVWKSFDGLKWTQIKAPANIDPGDPNPSMWESRHTAGYVVYNNEMWIIGGDPIHYHYQNDIWKSKDGQSWTRVASDVPWRNRVLHYTLVHNGKIWVMGGQTLPQFAGGNLILYNDVWSTTDGINWISYPDAPWSPRGVIVGNVVFNNRMWIIGGSNYSGKTYNDVWSSDDGINWTQHTDFAPWQAKYYQNVIAFDGKMWILGGANAAVQNTHDVWYSSDGSNWYELPNTPWSERHAASVYSYDNSIWMIAGKNYGSTGAMISDVWKLSCQDHIPQSADELDIAIYPNPSENFIVVRMKNSIISQLNVKDILGRNLMTKKMTSDMDIIELDITGLKTGIYIMECTDENGFVKSKKFVKY